MKGVFNMSNRKSMPEKNTKEDKRNFHKKGRNDGNRNKRRDDAMDKSSYREGDNDISWYSKYPQLLVAGGSFPYPYRPGMDLDLGKINGGTGITSDLAWSYRIPGVMSLLWMPSVGVSNTVTDPASVMAKELYAKVRAKFSGSLDADAPDFVMYLMALDSVYAYIAWLKRLYRTLNAWTPQNHALPDTLLAGFNITQTEANDLRLNKTQLWQCINELILQSRKFICPAVMDIFNRHYWMSDNVYLDDQTMNSQIYCFHPQGLYKLAQVAIPDGSGNTAAGLKMVGLPVQHTVTKLYEFGLSLISAIAEWDDGYTISGYLMRAFEGVPSFTVEDLGADEILAPIYSPEVLSQIQNSFTVSDVYLTDDNLLTVAQNPATNVVVSNPQVYVTKSIADGVNLKRAMDTAKPLFSMDVDNPGAADNVIASRLNAMFTFVKEDTVTAGKIPVYVYAVDCGTEIPCAWYYKSVPAGTNEALKKNYVIPQIVVVPQGGNWEALKLAVITQFQKCPLVRVAVQESSGGGYTCGMLGDVHNVTTVDRAMLANLHKICLYSEFNAFSI
nr:capsid protein [Otarine picobirnavirus]